MPETTQHMSNSDREIIQVVSAQSLFWQMTIDPASNWQDYVFPTAGCIEKARGEYL